MFQIGDLNITRAMVLDYIFSASAYGNLGIFIGSGFSIAAVNDEAFEPARTWKALLMEAAKKLKIDDTFCEDIFKSPMGYPRVASAICEEYARLNNCELQEAELAFKSKIASLTNYHPDNNVIKEYRTYLETLDPSWIMTTNYDTVIEEILAGKSLSLTPEDSLVAPNGIVPIYHLHGIRTNPGGIIITEGDYITLFRPNEYRQIKLALTIKESTTLFLGYSLNDINVLTAHDWSKNVFKNPQSTNTGSPYPNEIIQVLYNKYPKTNPYKSNNGVVIIETNNLSCFFNEYTKTRNSLQPKSQKEKNETNMLLNRFYNPEDSYINDFMNCIKFRREELEKVSTNPNPLISGFEYLLDKCLDMAWERCSTPYAFNEYDSHIHLVIDVLKAFDTKHYPPSILRVIAYDLQLLGPYIGDGGGQSWSAHKTWKNRRNEIDDVIIKQLQEISDLYGYVYIKKLFKA